MASDTEGGIVRLRSCVKTCANSLRLSSRARSVERGFKGFSGSFDVPPSFADVDKRKGTSGAWLPAGVKGNVVSKEKLYSCGGRSELFVSIRGS